MKWLANLCLSLLAFGFYLGIGEAVLRQWFPLGNVILRTDANYLYKFIPNSRQLVRPVTNSDAPTVLVTINSQGRRGPLVEPGQQHRVMVYGDSFIAAEGTQLQQTFVSQLGEMLHANVFNCGVPGYGPDQSSLVMEDEIDRVRPELIVFAIYSGNDFGDLVRNKLFRLEGRNHPVLSEGLAKSFEPGPQSSLQLVRRFHAISLKQAAVVIDGPGLPAAWLRQAQKEYAEYGDNEVRNLFADGYDIDISTAPQSDSAKLKVALMTQVMERVHNIAAKRSIPLLFLIIPSPVDALDQWDVAVNRVQFPGYQRTALTGAVETIARDRGYRYLNLFEAFHAHQNEDIYYRGFDDHWNAKGQHLAASLTADSISRSLR